MNTLGSLNIKHTTIQPKLLEKRIVYRNVLARTVFFNKTVWTVTKKL